MEGFKGGSIEAVYGQWGAPDRAEDLGGGERALHWSRKTSFAGDWCEINILTKDNVVTTLSAKGTYCSK